MAFDFRAFPADPARSGSASGSAPSLCSHVAAQPRLQLLNARKDLVGITSDNPVVGHAAWCDGKYRTGAAWAAYIVPN
eukprot:6036670-Prymnesium_polylepis.1